MTTFAIAGAAFVTGLSVGVVVVFAIGLRYHRNETAEMVIEPDDPPIELDMLIPYFTDQAKRRDIQH